ncbi:MAG: TRZ/ATZ family hydrolase [Gammaproteobacteria bacterium]|jgi:5-methylthioadenosine/S-adenosylhomocysteine deaminase|nr:TRZ/ATZ family hydrolase [Gammaproteobacteria bacterium]
MTAVDILINSRWIAPVEPPATLLEHHSVAIHEGRILDILPTEQALRSYTANIEHSLQHHLLVPGLINTHTHAAMSLLRGLADDLPLDEWLNNHIWPAESRWVNEEFVHDGTQLAMAEMLRCGTTCFNDMYFFPDITARAAAHCGMRATVGLIVLDFPTVWAHDADEYISRGLAVHDQYRGDPLIRTLFAPHAPYTVSDKPLEHIRVLADELDIGIHMHVHETADEVDKAIELTGKRPLQRLQDLGLLSPAMLAVHMTQLSAEEISLYAASGAHMVHCPESNLKLASGFCPTQALSAAGINVALGTDGAASNNDLDMLGEMRTAALLGKAVSGDASALPAASILEMATLNGARALGIDADTGSLLPGKWADITAVCLDTIETQPVYNPVSQLVYACGREQVTDVWVAGRHLLKERRLTTLDGNDILERSREWRARISAG